MNWQSPSGGLKTFTVDMVSILCDLRRHWWNILIMALSGALISVAIPVSIAHPKFQSNTILAVIGNNGSSVSNVQNASRMSSAITSVLSSEVFRQIVSEKIGRTDYTLSASYVEDTNLINITATGTSARLAFQVLQSTLEEYPILLSDLMSDLYVVTVQPPQIPSGPVGIIPTWMLLLIGAAIGGGVYATMVVLLSMMRDTVKNVSDMRSKIESGLLGTIPFFKAVEEEADRLILAKCDCPDFRYEESFQLIASRVMTLMEHAECNVLAVTSVTPNEGKTHALINLAYSMTKMQKKVLLVDGDFRNPSLGRIFLGKDKAIQNLNAAIQNRKVIPELLNQVPDTEMYYLSTHNRSSKLSRSLSDGTFMELLTDARNKFDYILVDTGPAALVADTRMIVSQCDASVMIVAQDAASIRAINDTIDILSRESVCLGCIYRETRISRDNGIDYGYGYNTQKSVERRTAAIDG